jgi:hypothetical protein
MVAGEGTDTNCERTKAGGIISHLRKEFDEPLISERKLLARQLLDGATHETINEPVMNFFEDMGMLLRRGFLDRDMLWDTFSYYARMWWTACRDYIATERSNLHDATLFADFDWLAEQIAEDDVRKRGRTRAEIEPSALDLRAFLEGEAGL